MLKRFISVFDVPLDLANAIYSTANVILVIGVVLVTTGTIAAIWSGGIRDRFADEQVSQNKADAARANEGAAKANERAAELEKEAEQARLARISQTRLGICRVEPLSGGDGGDWVTSGRFGPELIV